MGTMFWVLSLAAKPRVGPSPSRGLPPCMPLAPPHRSTRLPASPGPHLASHLYMLSLPLTRQWASVFNQPLSFGVQSLFEPTNSKPTNAASIRV
jgi:hypothetical protein